MFKIFLVLIGLGFGSSAQAAELIVWNVGQGQWITAIHAHHCQHFDIGGEYSKISRVLELCRGKRHEVFISHLDWDHISFLGRLAKSTGNICLLNDPLIPTGKNHFQKFYRIRRCQEASKKNYVTLFAGQVSKISNQTSAVVFLKDFHFLIPGDSPKNMEKKWRSFIPRQTRVFILGHHGSRTSNSKKLLQSLSGVRMAIASARSQRYGHPHAEVTHLAKSFSIPLLKTEDWGNLRFKK